MKWYLVRNTSHEHLTAFDLLEIAAKSSHSLKGHGKLATSEEMRDAYRTYGSFKPHTEQVVSLLGKNDRGKGIVCTRGLHVGKRGPFLIREVASPRHIWTEKDKDMDTDETD